jgi:hypothetical protein
MSEPLFVLNPKKQPSRFAGVARVISTPAEVRAAFASHRRARWVADRESALALLVDAGEARDTWHRLLLVEGRPSNARRELLHALFRVVVMPDDDVRLLDADDLEEVFKVKHPEDYFIGGVVDREDRVLVLYRGNLERLLVPLSWFGQRARAPKPNFDGFEITDVGQTIRFGEYEAAADAILYDLDADSRRRMKEREIRRDRSFGGALRRLRLQKGVSRSDFPGIDAKTVARIERGDVARPHEETVAALAKRLGVEPEAIETF